MQLCFSLPEDGMMDTRFPAGAPCPCQIRIVGNEGIEGMASGPTSPVTPVPACLTPSKLKVHLWWMTCLLDRGYAVVRAVPPI